MNNKKRIWEFFIDNFRFTMIFLLGIVLFGAFSILQIPKESQPDIDIPVVVVTTFFPGANAEDVEELVTNVIEDGVVSLEDVDDVSSTSRNGLSSVVIQFDVDADSTEKLNDAKDAVDLVKNSLPEDAEDPVIQKVRLTDIPVITLSIMGPYQVSQLKDFAELIKDETETVSGVSTVNLVGGLDREVHVIVDKARLDQYSLGINQVTQAISAANSEIPIGVIESAQSQYTINFVGKLEKAEEVADIPITQINGVPVLVRDVAQVYDGFNIPTSKSRVSQNQQLSTDSVSLRYFKTSGGNVVQVIDAILARVAELQATQLPEELQIVKTEDNAEFVRNDLNNLVTNGGQTILIVALLLLLFVGFREAMLAALVIPFTFLLTFIVLNQLGFTLNFMTLFSLILSLGILVDGSIVITQGMNAYIRAGKTPKEAARQTIRDFELPLISGTLTTVFAFVPMLMSSGIIGKYIRTIPVTVTIVLLSSLFVALGLITSIGSTFLKAKKEQPGENAAKEGFFIRKVLHPMRSLYISIFDTLLASKASRRLFTFGVIAALIASFSLPVTGILKVEMFPQSDQQTFYINFEHAPGTPLDLTNQTLEAIEQELYEDSRINSYVVNVGSLASASSTSSLRSNAGSITVNLKKKEERTESSSDILTEYQNKLAKYNAEGSISVEQASDGPENGAPVEVKITGESLETLEEIAADLERLVADIEGTENVGSTVQTANPEFVMNFDRVKAQVYGITTNQLAFALRNAINGLEATKIKKDGEEIKVIVKYSLDPFQQEDNITNRVDISTIENLTIATPRGDVPLSNFVTTSVGASRQSISHIDGQRIVKVTSQTRDGIPAQVIFQRIEERLGEVNIPTGYEVQLGGEREDIQKSFSDMFRAMILGVLLIAALLVLQFKSYRQPLFILATIPLALIAVFPGLVMINMPLSFPGIIGVVALVGIVVNNAIILIDRINSNRQGGMGVQAAIREAGIARFDPILLTTITTVFGILPLAIRDETWGPLGWSIVFGLTFSTVLTLLVVPLLYNRFARKGRYKTSIDYEKFRPQEK
jgi:multidrug efflux pump subunit AcrB